MKNEAKLLCMLVVFFICIFLIIGKYVYNIQNEKEVQDDIIFFKNIGFESENKKSYSQNEELTMYFDVTNKKKQEKYINITNTIDKSLKFSKIIAPGTKGSFSIKIYSYKKSKYKVCFTSCNKKPKNLLFNLSKNSKYYSEIEDLNNLLIGTLNENETKTFKINWKWNYEQNEKEDIQDTEDGKNISQYKFQFIVLKE